MKPEIENLIKNLNKNHFKTYFVENEHEASNLFFNEILLEINPKTVSYADSLTLKETKILDKLRENTAIHMIETMGNDMTWEEKIQRRREALLVDLFLTGTNAITEDGKLINPHYS